VVGFGGAFIIFVLALVLVRARRRAALAGKQGGPAQRYAVDAGGASATGAAAVGAPVAEGAEAAAVPRAAAVLREAPSPVHGGPRE
jgi:hypothetical protein